LALQGSYSGGLVHLVWSPENYGGDGMECKKG